MLTLTKNAQAVLDLVNNGSHVDDLEEGHELQDFVASISTSDGFWYAINDGGFFKLSALVEEAAHRELTHGELLFVEELWGTISYNF